MTEEATKTCPYCAETIKAAAVVCKHCGRDLVAQVKPAPHLVQQVNAYSCSECGGFLRPGATNCKHCKAVFAGPVEVGVPQTIPPAKKVHPFVIIVAAVLIVLLLFGALLGSGGRGNSSTSAPDRVSAWVDCREFVTKNLKSPSTAQFPLSNADGVVISQPVPGRWFVDGYVDAQNAFGAVVREHFGCQISYNGSTVTLHKLRIGDQTLLDN